MFGSVETIRERIIGDCNNTTRTIFSGYNIYEGAYRFVGFTDAISVDITPGTLVCKGQYRSFATIGIS